MSTKNIRMSIDIEPKAHKRLKMLATSQDLPIRDFVLSLIYPAIYGDYCPNDETLEAMEEAEQGSKDSKANDLNDLFSKLGI